MIFVNDLVTSTILFAQYSTVPSRAFLVLANGYLFTALIVIPQALTFPGGFAPAGLLGAGPQTPAWLYVFWHLGSPVAMLAYACLKGDDSSKKGSAISTICWSVTFVVLLVCGLTWISIAGDRFLPAVFPRNGIHNIEFDRAIVGIVTALFLLIIVSAFAVLLVRRRSVLDYWLMLVLCAFVAEHIVTAYLTSSRFTPGFYAGRIFLLVTSILVLILLLSETNWLYANLARANLLLERERQNKLMTAQAVTGTIAHEMRQPLAAITTNAIAALRWLGRTPPDHDEIRAALNRIKNDGHRASEVFDGIRTLFGKVDQRRQQVDVNDIIYGVMQSLQGQLNDHGVLVHRELTAGLPLVAGHPGQLREVIFNLVNNAIEAMDTRTDRRPVLRVKTELRGYDSIVVSVQDSGPGIDPKRLDGIFDAFVTTKATGTGLGLAICRMIIEQHGGQLAASSDGKSGALFQFILSIEPTDGGTASAN
jgi:signal transduction histidine kinase